MEQGHKYNTVTFQHVTSKSMCTVCYSKSTCGTGCVHAHPGRLNKLACAWDCNCAMWLVLHTLGLWQGGWHLMPITQSTQLVFQCQQSFSKRIIRNNSTWMRFEHCKQGSALSTWNVLWVCVAHNQNRHMSCWMKWFDLELTIHDPDYCVFSMQLATVMSGFS